MYCTVLYCTVLYCTVPFILSSLFGFHRDNDNDTVILILILILILIAAYFYLALRSSFFDMHAPLQQLAVTVVCVLSRFLFVSSSEMLLFPILLVSLPFSLCMESVCVYLLNCT